MDEKLYLDQYDNGNPDRGIEDELSITEDQIAELEKLVGETLFLFNSLETALDSAIAEAVHDRTHQPGYAITSELLVFAKKVLVFKSLYGMLVHSVQNDQLTAEFESLWKQLFKLKDVRNDVAHADWLEATNEYEVRLRIATDEKGPYSIRKKMPPAYLREKIDEIKSAMTNIDIFTEHKENILAHGRILTEEDYLKK